MYKHTIDNKPIFKKENGEEVRDLTATTFDMSKYVYSDYKVYKVSNSMVMRPDLLSNSAYGTTEYTEMVLKYNNISNPFSIDVDDLIVIPNKDNIMDVVLSSTTDVDDILRLKSYKYIDPTKFPKDNGITSNFDNRIPTVSNMETVLPPNITDVNEEQISMRGGRVYFGENIGKSCLYDGMSSGEYLQTIVKNNKI